MFSAIWYMLIWSTERNDLLLNFEFITGFLGIMECQMSTNFSLQNVSLGAPTRHSTRLIGKVNGGRLLGTIFPFKCLLGDWTKNYLTFLTWFGDVAAEEIIYLEEICWGIFWLESMCFGRNFCRWFCRSDGGKNFYEEFNKTTMENVWNIMFIYFYKMEFNKLYFKLK